MPKGIFIRTKEHNANLSKSLSGKLKSLEHVRNMSTANKGIGRKHTPEAIARMKTLSPRGENHHNWKGGKVSYVTKHQWIHRNFGKANTCENNPNHMNRKYEYSNISGSYLRDREDYKMLCVSCHRKLDYQRRLNAKRNSVPDGS